MRDVVLIPKRASGPLFWALSCLARDRRHEGALDGGEQRARAALNQIEHALEVFRLAIIGVRDVAQAKFGRKVEEQREMAAMIGRPQCFQKTEVLTVHRHDPLEPAEIIEVEEPRALV